MKKSGFLQKQEQERALYIEATEAIMKQFMCDTLQIAVSEEFGFGAERIARLVKRWGAIYSKYYPCLNSRSSAEADVLRHKLDEEIMPLLPAHLQWLPFDVRYPDLKRVRYGK